MTIRLRQQVFAIAIALLATPSVAEPFHGSRPYDGPPDDFGAFAGPVIFVSDETKQQDPDTDILALMAGKCSTLKIAGRDFACRAIAFFHGEQGRANFAIALEIARQNPLASGSRPLHSRVPKSSHRWAGSSGFGPSIRR